VNAAITSRHSKDVEPFDLARRRGAIISAPYYPPMDGETQRAVSRNRRAFRRRPRPPRSRCDGIQLGPRLSFLFTKHSQNKRDGTVKATEHRASPLVVGVGNAST
jgi:hypothetical protein